MGFASFFTVAETHFNSPESQSTQILIRLKYRRNLFTRFLRQHHFLFFFFKKICSSLSLTHTLSHFTHDHANRGRLYFMHNGNCQKIFFLSAVKIACEFSLSFSVIIIRKMAELGYHRNARKCKEKFENVFKYHKRTKEGRASKPESKSYRFFDQLEALEAHPPVSGQPNHPRPTMPPATRLIFPPQVISNISSPTVPSSLSPIINVSPISTAPVTTAAAANLAQQAVGIRNFGSVSTSSSTSSDEDIERRSRKKRKWELFFQRLMKDVMEKQEAMQKKFLETLEKRERDRVAREESWRVMEMARMNREHDILVQERSTAAAKDAAVIAFLQKVSDHQLPIPPIPQIPIPNSAPIQMQIQIPPQPKPKSQETTTAAAAVRSVLPPVLPPPPAAAIAADIPNSDNGNENLTPASSSRWPKAEVQALIGLRTTMDLKYQDNGPKGPLWEEISSSMKKLGYNRNAKRCKEKWENINKYFKKVKESNKRRPEDSKTCPYFHQLDAIYREKSSSKQEITAPPIFPNPNSTDQPENLMVPIMVEPEQQWPLQPVPQRQQLAMGMGGDHVDSDNGEDDDEIDDDEDDDDDDAGGYEIVTNKPPSSVGTVE